MSERIFNPMEIDAIGEIMNISLGSSATAISNLLEHRVDITTPKVTVINAEDFSLGDMKPAVGVEIRYVAGLDGSNIMLLKSGDVHVIVDILMGMETPDEEFELNELSLSAICEVMNQMMGSSCTALSDFLGRVVNISTPQTFDGTNVENIRSQWLPAQTGPIVVVRFRLTIEGKLDSEFINVMSVQLAKELVSGFGLGDDDQEPAPAPEPEPASDPGRTLSQAEIEAMMAAANGPAEPEPASDPNRMMSQEEIEAMLAAANGPAAPPPPPPAPEPSGGGRSLSQDEINALLAAANGPEPEPAPAPTPPPAAPAPAPAPAAPAPAAAPAAAPQAPYPYYVGPDGQPLPYPPMYYPMPQAAPQAPPAPPPQKLIHTQSPQVPTFEDGTPLGEEQRQNLDLIMGVPLELAVEIGRTRKKVQDILALSKGSLVVLDKLAGEQVDVYVNGKIIAQGDVVVVDDNFGIRITEILGRPGPEDLV